MAALVKNLYLGDARLQLGAEELLRQMPWGTQWTYIRIGIRLMPYVGASFTGLDMSFGVCQGPYGKTSPSTVDAIGLYPSAAVNPMLQSFIYTSNYWYMNGSGCIMFRKVGTAIQASAGGVGSSPTWPGNALGNTNVTANYVDILKTATGVTFNFWTCGAASSQINVTRVQHLLNMEIEAAPNVAPGTAFTELVTAVAFAITSSQLWDTVFFSWNRLVPTVDIHDVDVARFY